MMWQKLGKMLIISMHLGEGYVGILVLFLPLFCKFALLKKKKIKIS